MSPVTTAKISNSEHLADTSSSVSKRASTLSSSLLGWYAVCTSEEIKADDLYFFSFYNEPLVLFRDKDSKVRCIKDLCPHRGASFRGGENKEGIITCPYHGGRFSAEGECLNLDRLTCNHIIDSNYNNYAKKIHLNQYPCIEKGGYLYIYYSGESNVDPKDIEIKYQLDDILPDSFGFNTSEYAYEQVFVDFKCDWARIIENHLDILHIFWIHGNTIPDKDVNRNTITSFNQEIKGDHRYIESVYKHKDKDKEEFITLRFVPPGRVMIYKGKPEQARYLQVLDHIPLAQNRARVIVRHYRKFLKNKLFTKLILFKPLQHRIFYKIFTEDYLVLKTQTFNQQMGYIKKDRVKLLGEDKMIQYYWQWLNMKLDESNPWLIHPTDVHTNTVYNDIPMIYPPENPSLVNQTNRSIIFNLILRVIPLGLLILLI